MNPSASDTLVDEPLARLGPRSGHPVTRFVGAIVVLLAVLGGIRLSGAVNPWIEVTSGVGGSGLIPGEPGSIPGETGDPAVVRTFLEVELHNKGLTTFELTDASFTAGSRGDGADPVVGFFLAVSTAESGPLWSLGAPSGADDVGAPGPGLRPFRPVDIDPAKTQRVVVFHRTTCESTAGTLHLEVESPLGRSRTLDLPMDQSYC